MLEYVFDFVTTLVWVSVIFSIAVTLKVPSTIAKFLRDKIGTIVDKSKSLADSIAESCESLSTTKSMTCVYVITALLIAIYFYLKTLIEG